MRTIQPYRNLSSFRALHLALSPLLVRLINWRLLIVRQFQVASKPERSYRAASVTERVISASVISARNKGGFSQLVASNES